MPPWQYAALVAGEAVDIYASPAAMVMWTDWAAILRAAEDALGDPEYFTTETETF